MEVKAANISRLPAAAASSAVSAAGGCRLSKADRASEESQFPGFAENSTLVKKNVGNDFELRHFLKDCRVLLFSNFFENFSTEVAFY